MRNTATLHIREWLEHALPHALAQGIDSIHLDQLSGTKWTQREVATSLRYFAALVKELEIQSASVHARLDILMNTVTPAEGRLPIRSPQTLDELEASLAFTPPEFYVMPPERAQQLSTGWAKTWTPLPTTLQLDMPTMTRAFYCELRGVDVADDSTFVIPFIQLLSIPSTSVV
jgi:hypothetical protein